ncbi:MAG: hypothetical protein JW706_06320 [Opitutales bacterium]|nr:hypothetical protein [Opitutales bacterium]
MPEFDEETQKKRRSSPMTYEPGRNAGRSRNEDESGSDRRRRRPNPNRENERSLWVEAATATPHEDSAAWKTKQPKSKQDRPRDNRRRDNRQRGPRKLTLWQKILALFGIKPKSKGPSRPQGRQDRQRSGDGNRGDRNRPARDGSPSARAQGGQNRPPRGDRPDRQDRPQREGAPLAAGGEQGEDRPRRDNEGRGRRSGGRDRAAPDGQNRRSGEGREDRPRREGDGRGPRPDRQDRGPRPDRQDRGPRPDRPRREPRPEYGSEGASEELGGVQDIEESKRFERTVAVPRSDDKEITLGPIELKPKDADQETAASQTPAQSRAGKRNRRGAPARSGGAAASAKSGEFVPRPLDPSELPSVAKAEAPSDAAPAPVSQETAKPEPKSAPAEE